MYVCDIDERSPSFSPTFIHNDSQHYNIKEFRMILTNEKKSIVFFIVYS